MDNKETHIDIFIAYARKDKHFLDELRIYLKPLHRNKTIKIWYDGEILPGSVWEKDIKASLHNADIVLLLVSAYSLDSDYFYDTEMTEALERHERGETIVVPVIISECTWELTDLNKLQALPTNGKALNSWDDESKGYTDIVRGLIKNIDQVKKRRNDHAIAIKLTEEEELSKAEEETKKNVEEEQKLKEELETKRDKEEQRLKDELEAIRQEREELNKRKVEEELKRTEELEFKKHEKEQKLKGELEGKRKAEKEQQLKKEFEPISQKKDQRPTKKTKGEYFWAYVFILVVSGLISLSGFLLPIDLWTHKKLYLKSKSSTLISENNISIKNKIVFVEIPRKSAENAEDKNKFLRTQVANLLDTIGGFVGIDKPPIVILNISFSSNNAAMSLIINSITNLEGERIKVYSAYKLRDKDGISYEDHDILQAQALYNNIRGRRLNTVINDHVGINGIVSYDSFKLMGFKPIASLPVKVANDYLNKETDLRKIKQYILPLDLPFDPKIVQGITYEFVHDSVESKYPKFSKNNKSIYLSDKFVVISLSGGIQKIGGYKIPGPFLLATALVDQLNGPKVKYSESIVLQLVMGSVLALLVCRIFWVLYKYVKRLQTNPLLIAALSFIIGLLLLIGVIITMRQYTFIRPGFPALSMLGASMLAWHFTIKFLVTKHIHVEE